uniref:Rho-GAP domain-containing protein n=1 Tax=Podarcis muralis TaxID=64176 RepID=A0A670ICY7_PODMU
MIDLSYFQGGNCFSAMCFSYHLKKMFSCLQRCLNHKGLFRICGSVTKIKALKEKYDQGEEVDLVNEGDVNSIASLLKLFLNELPVAVIPDYLYNKSDMADRPGCTLRRLLSSLPKAHYSLFHFLIRFLVKVAAHSDENHMTMENLANVFGPTLFRPPLMLQSNDMLQNTSAKKKRKERHT